MGSEMDGVGTAAIRKCRNYDVWHMTRHETYLAFDNNAMLKRFTSTTVDLVRVQV